MNLYNCLYLHAGEETEVMKPAGTFYERGIFLDSVTAQRKICHVPFFLFCTWAPSCTHRLALKLERIEWPKISMHEPCFWVCAEHPHIKHRFFFFRLNRFPYVPLHKLILRTPPPPHPPTFELPGLVGPDSSNKTGICHLSMDTKKT